MATDAEPESGNGNGGNDAVGKAGIVDGNAVVDSDACNK